VTRTYVTVIIIGYWAGGQLYAAIYSAGPSQRLHVRGSVTAGGAMMQTTDVENFPRFPRRGSWGRS